MDAHGSETSETDMDGDAFCVGMHLFSVCTEASMGSSPHCPVASEEGTGQMANISLQGHMKAWTPLTLNAGFSVHLRIYDGFSVFLPTL